MGLTTNGDLAQLMSVVIARPPGGGPDVARRPLQPPPLPLPPAIASTTNCQRSRDGRLNWHKSIVHMFSSSSGGGGTGNPVAATASHNASNSTTLPGQVFYVCCVYRDRVFTRHLRQLIVWPRMRSVRVRRDRVRFLLTEKSFNTSGRLGEFHSPTLAERPTGRLSATWRQGLFSLRSNLAERRCARTGELKRDRFQFVQFARFFPK